MYITIYRHLKRDILWWYQSPRRLCNFDELKHFPWNAESFEFDNKLMFDPRKQLTSDEKTSY